MVTGNAAPNLTLYCEWYKVDVDRLKKPSTSSPTVSSALASWFHLKWSLRSLWRSQNVCNTTQSQSFCPCCWSGLICFIVYPTGPSLAWRSSAAAVWKSELLLSGKFGMASTAHEGLGVGLWDSFYRYIPVYVVLCGHYILREGFGLGNVFVCFNKWVGEHRKSKWRMPTPRKFAFDVISVGQRSSLWPCKLSKGRDEL